MAQSGPVPPAHSRRHRTEHHSMDVNNVGAGVSSSLAAGGRFGDTEWEARDVRLKKAIHWCAKKYTIFSLFSSLNDNVNLKRPGQEHHKWKRQ